MQIFSVCEEECKDLKEKSYEKIGALYGRVFQLLDKQKAEFNFVDFFEEMGVSSKDEEACAILSHLLNEFKSNEIVIRPSETTGSMYEICTKDKKTPFAVFKIGHLRATMEIFARRFAHLLGLERHIVAGMFCTLLNPTVMCDPYQDPDCEQLYNGNLKVFLPPTDLSLTDELSLDWKSTAGAVVGIVEPFLTHAEFSVLEFAKMTLLTLALGLRDGKKDGYREAATLVDIEDYMPYRTEPDDWQNYPSALHLPYLGSPEVYKLSHEELNVEECRQLYHIVSQWDVSQITKMLDEEIIRFKDGPSENLSIDEYGIDIGGLEIKIEEQDPHQINPIPSKEFLNSGKLLAEQQIAACITRLTRLQNFIQEHQNEGKTFSLMDLVYATDYHYAAHHRRASSLRGSAPSSHPSPTLDREWSGFSPDHVCAKIGLASPKASGVELIDYP